MNPTALARTERVSRLGLRAPRLVGEESLAPGTMVGPYRIVAEIGRGGMGTVMLAEDARLRRQVAIKFQHAGAKQHEVDSFRHEARVLASLSNPHVVPVLDAGEQDGRWWFVMPFLEGRTLDQLLGDLEGDWLPLDVALGLAWQLCDALSVVHDRGLVHRDIKPGNVIVVGGTHVVLMDFGLAQPSAEREHRGISGTPHYLAPEDIDGKPLAGLDARRSDIYSLGVVLYELLAGTPPFDAADPYDVLEMHLHCSAPSLVDVRPDVPAAIDAVIAHALDKDPAARPATCMELRRQLRRARYGPTEEMTPLRGT